MWTKSSKAAAINSGIPKEKTAIIINQVCGSGLRSIVNGYQSLLTNSANFIIAGGQESMTNSIHDQMMKDGLTDAFYNLAPVAQLDRALGYGPGGSGFDS